MRVVVAMSGGVDSSVAAALVKEAGHEAIGVTMKLLQRLDTGFGCCGSPKDVEDAKRVCDTLGIPHYTVDMAEMFEKKVITPFVDSYVAGETPNPCVECNRHVKFHYLMSLAEAWNASKVATGHYARIENRESGIEIEYRLLKAVDAEKDQSYFLHSLTQKELAGTLFPVGELNKTQVREIARAMGLQTADKAESMEICFVPRKDYRSFITERSGAPETGEIVDAGGNVLGAHTGLRNYTLGQREGLGLAVGTPLYVVGMDHAKNRLVVGPRTSALVDSFKVRNTTWTHSSPSGAGRGAPEGGGEGGRPVEVKVRHRSRPVPAKVSPNPDGTLTVTLSEPQFAPAPGQSAVFYSAEEVLGGGIITR